MLSFCFSSKVPFPNKTLSRPFNMKSWWKWMYAGGGRKWGALGLPVLLPCPSHSLAVPEPSLQDLWVSQNSLESSGLIHCLSLSKILLDMQCGSWWAWESLFFLFVINWHSRTLYFDWLVPDYTVNKTKQCSVQQHTHTYTHTIEWERLHFLIRKKLH